MHLPTQAQFTRWWNRVINFLDSSLAQVALAIILVLTGYTLLFSFFFNNYTRQAVDQRKNELRRLVEMALNTIDPVREQQRNGELSPQMARAIGRDLISRMAFTDGGEISYLFMGSYTGEAVHLPYNPPREGDELNQQDAAGRNIGAEMVRAAKEGSGYVEYLFPAPGSDQPQKKISYVVGIPEWDSYIGTGMYLADVEAENQIFLRNSLLLMTGMFAFVFFAIFVSLRPAVTSYRTLLHLFEQVTHNPDATPKVPVERYRSGTEGWQLVSGFQEMLTRLQAGKQQVQESEERFNLAIKGATDGLWDWNIRDNWAYFSPRWKAMLGYSDDEFPNLFEEWRSRIHPDDLDMVMTALNNHLNGQSAFYEVEHRVRHKDGTYRWILARGASVWDASGRPYRMAGSHTDITRRKRIEEAIQRRDAILDAVRFASERFLAHPSAWQDSIDEVLGRLGRSADISRIYIFQNGVEPAGELYMTEIHVWSAPGVEDIPADINLQHMRYSDVRLERWAELMAAGETVHGQVGDFPEHEQAILKRADIRSMVLAPIFVSGAWWGYIGFDTRQVSREWSVSEIDALKAAANALGAVIQQNIAEQSIHEREELYSSIFENTTDGMIINSLDRRVVEVNPACCAMHGYTREEFLKLQPEDFVHPDSLPMVTEYMQALRDGREFRARSTEVRKDGSTFVVEVRGAMIMYKGEPHQLGVLRDITETQQAYQMLEQRVAERTRELSALLEVSHSINATLELQPLLSLILDQLRTLVDYSGASIFIREGDRIVNVDYRGPSPVDEVLQINIPRRSGVEEVLRRREPVIIDDVRGDSPLAKEFMSTGGDYMYSTFNYIRSWMGVPLMTKEWAIGVLCLDSDKPNYYTPQQAQLVLAIANQAAIAIENARLYEQAQQLAVLEERQRLARELHDSVSQALYGIALGARTARTLLDRDPKRVVDPLNYVLQLAEAGLAEMRALIFELRPESLQTEGLVAALNRQAASIRTRHSMAVSTEFCEEPPLPFDVKEAFYRIAQEALNNIIKHARATQIELRLTCEGTGMLLHVSDNGVGFNPNDTFPGHLGLQTMRERITRFGGELSIESAPGQGSTVQAWVKLAALATAVHPPHEREGDRNA